MRPRAEPVLKNLPRLDGLHATSGSKYSCPAARSLCPPGLPGDAAGGVVEHARWPAGVHRRPHRYATQVESRQANKGMWGASLGEKLELRTISGASPSLATSRACQIRQRCVKSHGGQPGHHSKLLILLVRLGGLEPPTKSLGTLHVHCHLLSRPVIPCTQVADSQRLPPSHRSGNTNTGSHLMTLLGNPHCGICAGRFHPPSPLSRRHRGLRNCSRCRPRKRSCSSCATRSSCWSA